MPGALSAAIHQRHREDMALARASPGRYDGTASTAAPLDPLPAASSHLSSGPPPFQSTQASRAPATATAAAPAATAAASTSRPATANQTGPSSIPLPTLAQTATAPSGPSTPSAVQFLASGGGLGAVTAQAGSRGQLLEFNHAISFVNKIKNRFNQDHDTYKQFLEILQTYQRDTRDIAEVC